MAKIFCPHHQNLMPVMIPFGISSLGTRQYICAVCSRVREFARGRIISFEGSYGFINGLKENFFFHLSNLAYGFNPSVGLCVSFEVQFLANGRIQAINIQPA
jgi:hypothetical protein